MSNEYNVLNDNILKAVWCCAECRDIVECNVWDYQNIGTPYCADCDEDMYYVETRLYNSVRERIM